jgi:hypothetical protein
LCNNRITLQTLSILLPVEFVYMPPNVCGG